MSTLGRTSEDVQKIPHTKHCENMHSNQIFIRHLFKITLIYYSYVVLYGIRRGGTGTKIVEHAVFSTVVVSFYLSRNFLVPKVIKCKN